MLDNFPLGGDSLSLRQNFSGGFPGTSLTVDFESNPEASWKFPPEVPWTSRTSPEIDFSLWEA